MDFEERIDETVDVAAAGSKDSDKTTVEAAAVAASNTDEMVDKIVISSSNDLVKSRRNTADQN